ncbi:M20 family metallo-hydrolase [Rhizobium sp. NPDC090279]|uniref:M20 family metallo-hydrolase n=1 Tax=Rhizobium sp. NPDC090279 TaxID=3364499 RepID=UPI00383A7E26
MTSSSVKSSRLLDRHAKMATFGETGYGGVIRPALSTEESEARRTLLDWARARGFICTVDPIGNLFIKRPGRDLLQPAVRTGSHLDSQIPGGNFDGVYGVLAAFEVLEALEDSNVVTCRPVEVVVWNNEEGARFSPTTMGSAVHAGALELEKALKTSDSTGIEMGTALAESLLMLGDLEARPLGSPSHSYVEIHIEQGPILETNSREIGIVTGIQGIAQFHVTVVGEEAHAGTTPRSRRKDALEAASDLIASLRLITSDANDVVRFTVGKMSVKPGAPNTVPSLVDFTIDLRHPNANTLTEISARILRKCLDFVSPCAITAIQTLNSPSVEFDQSVTTTIEKCVRELRQTHDHLPSGATHDAKFMAGLCPTGMIFIPCRDGISHNEKEWAEPSHMIAGAKLLLRVIEELAEVEHSR